ncbi:MAG: hypothetical protein A2083_02630 [Gemmatimonadetes bacterium GWC2_71_9]|nr:MAG: hypothetical protein A2083_02630 [Gemmatimonadetes bacterium GWC2_71_9]OGT96805.1 MAG: hypothetical protein A3I79_03045 [Gemmatimonadetes bacterium RIFCSPLOWO2_02_FULL_71_11]
MITFHRLLITTAILFCAGFSYWGWREYQETHTTWTLAATIAFAIFAVLLAVYLAFLKRFLGTK